LNTRMRVNTPSRSRSRLRATLLATCALFVSIGQAAVGSESEGGAPAIDQRSFRLGDLYALAEMVHLGVKKMALSFAVSPQELDALLEDAQRIARENNVELYRESDLLVTDLFPASVARGKQVLIIYKGSTNDQYLALKREKAQLVQTGQYTGKAREQIARKLGKLLSYPNAEIDRALRAQAER
jgi:hypothetical protein